MSRNARLLVLMSFVASALIALGALGMKSGGLPALPGLEFGVAAVSAKAVRVLAFIPCWILLGGAFIEWRLRPRAVRPSADYRRIQVAGFLASVAFCVLAQVWLAATFLLGRPPGGDLFVRLTTIFVGACVATQGNFVAKAAPPTGEKAPPAAWWTRHALRLGWGMVVVGLALVVGALALPARALIWAILIAVTALVALLLLNRPPTRTA
jgi:hypothetical protein